MHRLSKAGSSHWVPPLEGKSQDFSSGFQVSPIKSSLDIKLIYSRWRRIYLHLAGNRDEAVQIRPDNKPRLPPGFVAGHQERTYRTVGAMLGKGAFGVVYGAVSSDDNQWNPSAKYAIKACTKDYADNLKVGTHSIHAGLRAALRWTGA